MTLHNPALLRYEKHRHMCIHSHVFVLVLCVCAFVCKKFQNGCLCTCRKLVEKLPNSIVNEVKVQTHVFNPSKIISWFICVGTLFKKRHMYTYKQLTQ